MKHSCDYCCAGGGTLLDSDLKWDFSTQRSLGDPCVYTECLDMQQRVIRTRKISNPHQVDFEEVPT